MMPYYLIRFRCFRADMLPHLLFDLLRYAATPTQRAAGVTSLYHLTF